MLLKKFKNINNVEVILPILVIALLVALFIFVKSSLEVVTETNKANFSYTTKVRQAIEEIDKIVERAEVNLNTLIDMAIQTYDTNKLYDKNYNIKFVRQVCMLTKSILINTPGVTGSWFQVNNDLPFSGSIYDWFEYRDNKIIDMNEKLKNTLERNRKLNPKDDPYYFEAIKAKDTIWSSIYTDADTKIKMITIAKPIYKNNVLIGVAGIDISVANLKQALKNMQNSFEGSEVFLLDEHKNIILGQLLDNKLNQEGSFTFLKLFKGKHTEKTKMGEFIDEGVRKTAILFPLSNNYDVVLTFPNHILFKGFDRLFITIYFVLTILFILAGISVISRYKIIRINKELENEITTTKNIINHSPTIMCVKNAEGRYINFNSKFAEMVGLKNEDIIGKTDYDLFNRETAINISNQDNKVKQTNQCEIDEQWHINSKGEKILLLKYRLPLFDGNNKIVGVLINSIDITKKHEEQELLQKAKEAAEKANAMKSNFLANMSHEIRTPMNGVLGFLQLLEATNPTEEQKEFIADAQKSSELLLHTINEILDFSKIEAGKIKIDNISFDVRSVVEDVTVINTSDAYNKGIDINSLICSDVPQRVFGDPGRIKQILNNLVSNSIKFTQKGEIIIYVNLDLENDEDVILSFKVKDTGIGIPDDKLNLIFESFTQADSTTTRKYGGTGLGLTISERIAELMNGCLSVESIENKGSTFTLTMPFKKDSSNFKVKNSIKSLRKKHILIIDDKSTGLKIINYYLNEANCVVYEAHSIKEALEKINTCDNISAILIDDKIQNIEGTEIIQLLKANEKSKNIPLILYTALAKRGDAIEAREKGFAGFLTKPFKKQDLLEAVAIAINGKSKPNQEEFITKHLIKENRFSKKAHILMVEDTDLNCKFVLKLLNKMGLTCDIANDGMTAIEAFKNNKYDIILMDCQMPIMDGYETTKQIRKLEDGNSHIPIIAITANAMKSDEEKCYEAGMDGYISKPMKTEKLSAIISKYIEPENIKTNDIIQEMVEEVGFSEEEAVQLFKEFLAFLPEMIANLEKSLEENDYNNIKNFAHKLKGASSNLRIEKLVHLSAHLEAESPKEDKKLCLNIINEIKNQLNYYTKISNDILLK